MSFLTPLAFAFAAALPVVVLFYLLKRKRVVKLVSSTLLWQKFLADTQASAPFQKLRHNWLLLLQLLLLALLVFALARPYRAGQARETRLRVVVLDGSASMQATDEKPSRFERARAEALGWVDSLRAGEQMMILLAGASTEVKQSPTGDKTALRRALQACTASDAPTRLAEALITAGAFTYEKRGEEQVAFGEIHLFSDGAFPALGELENKNLPLVYHRIGTSSNNVGIVSLDVRTKPDDPAQRAVFASLANYSGKAQACEVELSFDAEVVETRPIELAPTNTQPCVFFAPQNRDGVFTLRLTVQDALATDNQASIVSLLPRPVKVLLVSRGNRFLERALRTLPHVELSVTGLLPEDPRGFDVVVLDDVPPATWPTANVLAIHVVHTNLFENGSTLENVRVVDTKNIHPLMRSVGLDNVAIQSTLAVKPPAWGLPLAEGPQATPLILAGERAGQRIIWIGFDPLQSTWPLRISYPIFVVNALEWLNPAGAGADHLLVRAGEPFRLRLPDNVTTAQVVLPGGTVKPAPFDPRTREVFFGDTARQGLYRLKAGTHETTFCVNLLDSAESNITPKDELPFGKYAAASASTLTRATVEHWRGLAVAGLAVLLFEWWYYHKRTA